MNGALEPLLGKRLPCPLPPKVVDVNAFPRLGGGGLIPDGRGALFDCGLVAAGRPKLAGRDAPPAGLDGLGVGGLLKAVNGLLGLLLGDALPPPLGLPEPNTELIPLPLGLPKTFLFASGNLPFP